MKVSCTECRQNKVKCVFDSSLTGTCLYCKKRNKICLVDPNFKRTSRIKQIQQLRNEVNNYKHALISTKTSQSDVVNTSNNTNNINSSIQSCTSDKTLHDIHLTKEKINCLFYLFFTHCHPYLPFSVSTAIDEMYINCPLLFWVICTVASASDPALHMKLYPHVRTMISEITLYPARKVEIVQALLITSMWPFPSPSQLSDPSFLLSGLATHIGLQIGLHRPESAHEFSARPEILNSNNQQTKRTTWLACYFVDFFQSLRLGVPSTFVQDIHFYATLEHPTTPPFLSFACKMARLAMNACQTMDNYMNQNEMFQHLDRVDKIKLYIKESSLFQSTFFDTHDMSRRQKATLNIIFLVCRLHLFSFVITENTTYDSFNLIDIYYQAEKDAIQLIGLVQNDLDENIGYAPIYILRSVVYSALILLWVLKSEYVTRKDSIQQHISISQSLLVKLSRYDHDEPHRALNFLIAFSQSKDIKQSSPVKHRMGATLLYESIRMAKENSREIINQLLDSILNE